jgi:ribosomal protein S18 acetylase RimI-like enzyme
MGGWVAARWAELHPDRVHRLVLLCPGFDLPARWRELYGEEEIGAWRERGWVELPDLDGTPTRVGWALMADALAHPPYPEVPCPTLVLHGRRDEVVPLTTSETYAAGRPQVTLEVLDDDHGLVASLPVLERRVLEWFGLAEGDEREAEPRWEIRLAREQDATRLSELAERTFRETFAAANTAANLDLYCSRSFAPATQLAEIRDPATRTLVVERDGALVAYAQIRSGAAPAAVTGDRPIELTRIYALGEVQGSGLARELLDAALDEAARGGADVLWLGVWEHNPRALRFYRRQGFVEVGEQDFWLGNDRQRDLVMALPVRRWSMSELRSER